MSPRAWRSWAIRRTLASKSSASGVSRVIVISVVAGVEPGRSQTPRLASAASSSAIARSGSNQSRASWTSRAALTSPTRSGVAAISRSANRAASTERSRVSRAITRARQAGTRRSRTRSQSRGSRWASSNASPTSDRAASRLIPSAAPRSAGANSATHGAPGPASGVVASPCRSTSPQWAGVSPAGQGCRCAQARASSSSSAAARLAWVRAVRARSITSVGVRVGAVLMRPTLDPPTDSFESLFEDVKNSFCCRDQPLPGVGQSRRKQAVRTVPGR